MPIVSSPGLPAWDFCDEVRVFFMENSLPLSENLLIPFLVINPISMGELAI
jgi:hypothetical protein